MNLIDEVQRQTSGLLADYCTLTGWIATLSSSKNADDVARAQDITQMTMIMKATSDLMSIIHDTNVAAINQLGK